MTTDDNCILGNNGGFRNMLSRMYNCDEREIKKQMKRYGILVDGFTLKFGEIPQYIFSAPGRVEIIGNHTDHNGGCVIAASVNLDTIAAVAPNSSDEIHLFSEGYSDGVISMNVRDLLVKNEERNQTLALMRGVLARFVQLSYKIGGLNVYVSSDVMMGSGLSSSAAFEVLFGTIINTLFNKGAMSPVEIAQIGQFAENEYFGKPCGLMDQMASAVGGFVMIDFKDKTRPIYEKIGVDFQSKNYTLLIVDTKGDHQNLTPDYAGIPIEMGNVCRELGVNQCRDIAPDTFDDKIPELRDKVGDRAILRCMHFFKENERVGKMKIAMEEDNFSVFLDLINESGNSSFCALQNYYSPTYPDNQGISLGILLTQEYLKKQGIRGACRVHGGGFAGSYEVFLPNSHVDDYRGLIEKIFGTGTVRPLKIRSVGANSYRLKGNIR